MAQVFIIAEAGINHSGDMCVARAMIRVAAECGADAIKFQSFTAEELASRNYAPEQYEFFKRFELTDEQHETLAAECRSAGIEFLSTPFDFGKADLLERLGVSAYKIASCDLTNIPLIEHIARKGKPMYISTGMGALDEARRAYDAARGAGSPRVVMLHCTTLYPTPYSEANLRAITEMAREFDGEVGFSDHTVGNYACFAAVALGARVIEKHFTLDKTLEGPDIPGSCDAVELADLVRGVRAIETALGDGGKRARDAEGAMIAVARRSVFAARAIRCGQRVTNDMLSYKRPGTGIPPDQAHSLIGKVAQCDVEPDTMLRWDMVE
jgi:sialic acid synthase SpsE